ncbi:hypothetical protein KKE26_09040, partial [bacterium]|nr:hypothetical protein [bacterium]MBU1752277.1 hypothetical protein [bacterium]
FTAFSVRIPSPKDVGEDKANAGGDRGAASPVSAPPISDHKRRAPLSGCSYKDSQHTTIDHIVAAGCQGCYSLVPA